MLCLGLNAENLSLLYGGSSHGDELVSFSTTVFVYFSAEYNKPPFYSVSLAQQ